MSTDDTSTQETDSQDHQSQEDTQNSQDHSESSEKEGGKDFDARSAFNATNERVNKISKKLETIDPEVINQIATRLGITKEEAQEEVKQDDTNDVDSIVDRKFWLRENAERIASANKEGTYDQYIQEGLKPDHALRLAEQDQGIVVDTSKQDRQKRVSSAGSSVDRLGGAKAPQNYKEYDLSEQDIEKYGDTARDVVIHR